MRFVTAKNVFFLMAYRLIYIYVCTMIRRMIFKKIDVPLNIDAFFIPYVKKDRCFDAHRC